MCNIVLASVFEKYLTCSEVLIKICRSWSYHIGISSIYCCVLLKFRGCKWNGVNFNVWSFVTQSEKWSFWQRIFSWCKGDIRGEGGVLISLLLWGELQKEASKRLQSIKELENKVCCCLVLRSVICFPPFLTIDDVVWWPNVFNRLAGREWTWSSLDPWSHRQSVLSETPGLTTAAHTNTSPSSCFTADLTHIRLVLLLLKGINTGLVVWWCV